MNLTSANCPWYAQVGTFAVLALAAAGVFWNWYARPVQEEHEDAQAQLARCARTSIAVSRPRGACRSSAARSASSKRSSIA
jgi:membrane protein implicated in regulation of membrane protease activity